MRGIVWCICRALTCNSKPRSGAHSERGRGVKGREDCRDEARREKKREMVRTSIQAREHEPINYQTKERRRLIRVAEGRLSVGEVAIETAHKMIRPLLSKTGLHYSYPDHVKCNPWTVVDS
jgi:hypothetical protein